VDPVPDPLLLRKSGRAGNRTRDLFLLYKYYVQSYPLSEVTNISYKRRSRTGKYHTVLDILSYINTGLVTLLFLSVFQNAETVEKLNESGELRRILKPFKVSNEMLLL